MNAIMPSASAAVLHFSMPALDTRVHLRQPGEEAKLIELLGQSARFKMLNGKPQEAAKDFEVSQLVHCCIHWMPISWIYIR